EKNCDEEEETFICEEKHIITSMTSIILPRFSTLKTSKDSHLINYVVSLLMRFQPFSFQKYSESDISEESI
ncbi:MAG: hypothetical protein ACW97W_02315, partial [Candidatus Hodarchaeales archaeon]